MYARRIRFGIAPLLVFFAHSFCAYSQVQFAPAILEWNRSVEPFRIAGNLYYVGASDVSSSLIATPEGHILIDAGFRETAPLIEANLKKLGFRVEDVRLILTSHPHYDHAAGLAEIKAHSGARFLASPADAAAYERGGLGDFAFRDQYPFSPVKPDGLLADGKAVSVGKFKLTPRFTPGHSRGCTSWTLNVDEGARRYAVAIACSMSAPGYRLVANAEYPEIAQDYLKSFALLKALPCDIFLGLHSWDFALEPKMKARAANPDANPFIDPKGLSEFALRTEAAFRKQLGEERTKSGARQ